MTGTYYPLIIILATHMAIGLVMGLAHRFTSISKTGNIGVYIILLPMGFLAFGADLEGWFASAFVLAGVLLILWSLRRTSN